MLASEALLYLTYLGVIFIIGVLLSMFSNRLRIPNVILLLAFGIFLNYIQRAGRIDIIFPSVFISSIGLLALIMIIFDASSRFKIKEFDILSWKTLKLTFIFLLLNLVFLTIAVKYIFGIENILLALAFAGLMSGTSPTGIISFVQQSKNKVIEFLEIESILNTPIIVLLPFIFIGLIGEFTGRQILENAIFQFVPMIEQVISGIGSGVIIGLIFFKVMRRYYSPSISPIATVTAALITYVLAENLGGSGVLAVTTLGLFFGNVFIKEKEELHKFSFMFTSFLEVFVFIIIGLVIFLPFTADFILKSMALFGVFLLVRFISINMAFFRKEFSFKEKLFMTLTVPKGVAEAVVAIALSAFVIPQIEAVLYLVLAFLIYSILISTITVKFSRFFIRTEIIKNIVKK
jgi:cell volume regulation protein A